MNAKSFRVHVEANGNVFVYPARLKKRPELGTNILAFACFSANVQKWSVSVGSEWFGPFLRKEDALWKMFFELLAQKGGAK